jgi:hypothetical protein
MIRKTEEVGNRHMPKIIQCSEEGRMTPPPTFELAMICE